MEFIRGIHNIKPHHHGSVLTIGNFDGVHLGHATVISGAIAKAKALGVSSMVMLFEPQPMELFLQDKAPARLYRLRDKYMQLKQLGVDQLLCVKFTQRFSECTADEFIEQLLVKKLAICHLIVGDDFCFGKNRCGNFAMLVEQGEQLGFTVDSTQSFRLQDCRISSTAIRESIVKGNFAHARAMLGHPYSINGTVTHGDKKGREIGFPTANILLNRGVSPVHGVYAVTVNLAIGRYHGVANVGNRPTVNGNELRLEVHLFNFNGHIYGEHIEVQINKKLRDEQKFASLQNLKEQIAVDVEQAMAYFNA